MNHSLQHILQLEDNEDFEKAFDAYNSLYERDKGNYEIWKHFYFFLWIAIEDATTEFQEKINLRELLQKLFDEGEKLFSNNPDFNFIAGYTVSIFPYEYGEYEDMEEMGNQMLFKATNLAPENPIYRMTYLATVAEDKEYQNSVIEAAPKVLETLNGNGFLNKYFRQVLYRIETKASR